MTDGRERKKGSQLDKVSDEEGKGEGRERETMRKGEAKGLKVNK